MPGPSPWATPHRSVGAAGATIAAPAPVRRTAAARGGRVTQAIANRGVGPIVTTCVALFLFLSISRFHMHLKILATLRVPLLLGGIGLLLSLASTEYWKPRELFGHYVMKGVVLIFAIGIIGIPFSIYGSRSLEFLRQDFLTTVLAGVMAGVVSRTPSGARAMIKTIALGAIVACMLAVALGRHDNEGRLTGGYMYDPNDIALVANIAIPLVVWWALSPRERFGKITLAAIPLFIYVIIRSDSRGGFLALCATAVGFMVLGFRNVAPRLKVVSWLLPAALLVGIPFMPSSYLDRIRSIWAEDDYNVTSYSGRKNLWRRGMYYAFTHPLTGVGLENFRTAEGRDLAREATPGRGIKWSAPHNSWVQIFAELGLIAGTVFSLLFIVAPYKLIRAYRRNVSTDLIAPMLGITIITFVVAAFFLSWGYYDLTYILLALSANVLMQEQALQAAGAPQPNGSPPGRSVAAPVKTRPA